ncbi:glycosyltransferase [Candidatus Microgenomates bacterium]|nr:glycosyltransferase [Candidatus Microgenomates bacterium]
MSVVIYDPTAADAVSAARGIGRYMQLLKENLPDATFTGTLDHVSKNDTFLMPFLNFTQPPFVTKRLAKKQVAIIHDLIRLKYLSDFPIGLRGKLNVFRMKQTLKLYDIIVTDSEASKADIVKILNVPASKIRIVYPCLPSSLYTLGKQPALRAPLLKEGKLPDKDTPYFIYVGDATANKNLVRTARSVQAANATCVFVGKVFVQSGHSGNPWNKELNEFMELVRENERFVFPGFVPDEELVSLYKNAVANILLSHDEGFGFSFLEAANCKTPSLLADAPIFHETAVDAALFANPTNIEEIATTMKLLLSEKKLRNELAAKAFERSKFFSAEKFKKEWEEALS